MTDVAEIIVTTPNNEEISIPDPIRQKFQQLLNDLPLPTVKEVEAKFFDFENPR